MKKLWVAIAAVMTASLVLAICAAGASTPARVLAMSAAAATTPRFAQPTSVSVSSVTATGAVVKFVLPFSDRTATSERVVVYPSSNPNTTAFSATVSKSPVTVTGLNPSTRYNAEVSVNAANGHAASAWTVSSRFTTGTAPVKPTPTPTPTTSSPTPTPTPTTSSPTPTPTARRPRLRPRPRRRHLVADPDPNPDDLVADADADTYCPLRFGAVVVHHPGAELLRDRHHQRWLGNRCQQHSRGRRHLPGGEYQLLVVT